MLDVGRVEDWCRACDAEADIIVMNNRTIEDGSAEIIRELRNEQGFDEVEPDGYGQLGSVEDAEG